MRYLEPWEMEGEEALEIVVGTTKVAWTADDDVFVHIGDKAKRDDGYTLIGQLQWVDTPNDPADDAGYNIQQLRKFVLAWQKEGGAK